MLKLCLQAAGGEAGVGRVPLACSSSLEEHHLLLPDGISSFPLGSALFGEFLLTSDVHRTAALPCQCVGWQWPRFPHSQHTETLPPHPDLNFIPALSSRPFKCNVRAPLLSFIYPKYILMHPRGCFQGDSEPSLPRMEGQGQV